MPKAGPKNGTRLNVRAAILNWLLGFGKAPEIYVYQKEKANTTQAAHTYRFNLKMHDKALGWGAFGSPYHP
jgi:hypothetical protein